MNFGDLWHTDSNMWKLRKINTNTCLRSNLSCTNLKGPIQYTKLTQTSMSHVLSVCGPKDQALDQSWCQDGSVRDQPSPWPCQPTSMAPGALPLWGSSMKFPHGSWVTTTLRGIQTTYGCYISIDGLPLRQKIEKSVHLKYRGRGGKLHCLG